MDVLNSASEADADEICIGAEAIARDIFKGKLTPRQVYRLAEEGGWPIFRLRGKLAARPPAVRAEVIRRERLAVGVSEAA
jgi:hypothetical protein